MPELPEVEAARHNIASHGLHRPVEHVVVEDDRVLEVSAQKLWSNITGHEFEAAERHGKYIMVRLDNAKWLVLHLGMTGDIAFFPDQRERPEHSRVIFHFTDGPDLAFDNQRMFGEVSITDDNVAFIQSKQLGPDALDLDFDDFKSRLADRRGMIKTALMDQSLLAGIGNVYSDEILFQARLHPRTQVDNLSEKHLMRLFECLRTVLNTATDARINGEALPDDFFIPHRNPGDKCPNCGGEVEQIEISGRNAYCCPACQMEVKK